MADSSDYEGTTPNWDRFEDGMSDVFADVLEQNMRAQTALLRSWQNAAEEAASNGAAMRDVEGYAGAYRTWMEAWQLVLHRLNDSIEGEEVELAEFRDIWLDAANDAFKEMMGTEAFAAATGQSVDAALDIKRQTDEAAEDALHSLGFATRGDVHEVGERLVELERRQHAVESKLDELLEELKE